jgi:hypothetical protein
MRYSLGTDGRVEGDEVMVIAERTIHEPRPVRQLTPEEGRQVFDQAAWQYLHMSGDDFLTRWHTGEFDQDLDRSAIMRVAMLRHLVER